jgi:hypothetical protein
MNLWYKLFDVYNNWYQMSLRTFGIFVNLLLFIIYESFRSENVTVSSIQNSESANSVEFTAGSS